jgi:cytidylate kinase
MSIPVHRDLVERAVKRFQAEVKTKRQEASRKPRAVITISRQFGSGGKIIADILGQWLGWHVWDREILDVLAHQSHMGYQSRMFEAIDEKTQDEIENLTSSIFGQIDKHCYLHLLHKALLVIAQNDAIILGRGSHLFLPDSLRVRVKASLQTRIEEISKRAGISKKAAQEKIKSVDAERESFVKSVCHKFGKKYADTKEHLNYDLEINTDRISMKEASLLVLVAAKKKFNLDLNLEPVTKKLHIA